MIASANRWARIAVALCGALLLAFTVNLNSW